MKYVIILDDIVPYERTTSSISIQLPLLSSPYVGVLPEAASLFEALSFLQVLIQFAVSNVLLNQ